MSVKKPAIPKAPTDPERTRFDASVKETLEIYAGLRGSSITKLNSNAGLSDVIAKINEILELLQ